MATVMKSVMYYKLAILMFVLFSANSLASAIVASFMNTEWSSLGPTTRFLLIVVIIQNWTGTLLAFFNKSIAKLEQGKPLFDAGDTAVITKQQTEQKG